jgi:outer membrane immunogenic protein
MRPAGFTGGGQVGYNWQAGPVVLGIEADFNSLRLHKSRFIPNVPNASPDTFSLAASSENDWMATVRGRIGYAYDRLLLYFTGGLAISHQRFSQTLTQLNVAFFETGSVSATKHVPIFGGGLEYALGNGWSLKGEYLHANLGELAFSSAGSCPALVPAPPPGTCEGFTGNHSNRLRIEIARAGINYKFDWGKAPVVAGY